jgi:hypothetical protein
MLSIQKINWNVNIFQSKYPQNLCQPTTSDACDNPILQFYMTYDRSQKELYPAEVMPHIKLSL